LWHLQSSSNISDISHLPHPPFTFISLSHIPGSFSRYHFSIYIYVYTVFVLYSPSQTYSPPPLLSQWYQSPPPTPGKTYSPLMFSDFIKEKK
jgi:hypothetical protein